MQIEAGILAQPYALTKDGQKVQRELTDEVTKYNRAADKLAEDIKALRGADTAQWSASSEAEAAKLASRQRELVVAELELRKRIAGFFGRLRDIDLPAARDMAYQAHEQATADIRAAVVAIGYEDDGSGMILPPVIQRHPRVKTARIANDTLQASEPHYPARRENEAAIERCAQKLSEIKLSSVGILN